MEEEDDWVNEEDQGRGEAKVKTRLKEYEKSILIIFSMERQKISTCIYNK